ncbi:MAG: metallophosphoesterase family protein [Hyphomicrobiales bacterium]|nr:metallophosphoesterase family protein [Hyphomicrobiales bacterium]
MIAIFSDVHGNWPALRAVLQCIDDLGCASAISLGDVVGYYPFVNECCEALRSRSVVSLYGNHDHYLVSGAGCPRSKSASLCLAHQRATIADDHFGWLSENPRRLDFDDCSLVHGGWMDELEEYILRPSAAYFASLPQRLFFSGHTHVQGEWKLGSKTYCNPGSVGQPRDGDWRAAFATLAGGQIRLHRVEYEVEETIECMRALAFPDAFSANLRQGTRIGGETEGSCRSE